jgi:uncharacterized small protein (DUF1192 family)
MAQMTAEMELLRTNGATNIDLSSSQIQAGSSVEELNSRIAELENLAQERLEANKKIKQEQIKQMAVLEQQLKFNEEDIKNLRG